MTLCRVLLVFWGSVAKGCDAALCYVSKWVSNKRQISIFFFKFYVMGLDSFRDHKLEKLISNSFFEGQSRQLEKLG